MYRKCGFSGWVAFVSNTSIYTGNKTKKRNSPQAHPPYPENTYARGPGHSRRTNYRFQPNPLRHLNCSNLFRAERFWLGWHQQRLLCCLKRFHPFLTIVVFGRVHLFWTLCAGIENGLVRLNTLYTKALFRQWVAQKEHPFSCLISWFQTRLFSYAYTLAQLVFFCSYLRGFAFPHTFPTVFGKSTHARGPGDSRRICLVWNQTPFTRPCAT